ncbi:GspH/FimT family pseudopilin [Cupriavidus sp. CV2]|uniref:GspH/FimT family pseudopilin n=1 Tax=Cupriavidus TaxID=106589 RepID=UPI00296AEA2B|nr:GspH/FimT family pseudopilin [Cupriavidus sp. CV2]MDW3684419.1 GspH/FimT family pseudopilin [Cupriavidus sp. CV2]
MKKLRIQPGRANGFTLIELVITMTIAAILLAMATPSMSDFLRRQRLVSAADSFASAIAQARSGAAATNSYVTVAPIGAAWNNGWQVFSEHSTPDGAFTTSDTLLSQYDPIPSDITITFNTNPDATGYVAFSPVGYSITAATRSQLTATATFTLGTLQRVVEINALGRSRVCDPSRDTTCTASALAPP